MRRKLPGRSRAALTSRVAASAARDVEARVAPFAGEPSAARSSGRWSRITVEFFAEKELLHFA
jgi:hypothetical protein